MEWKQDESWGQKKENWWGMREKRTHSRTREKMNRKRKGWKEEIKKKKKKQVQLIDSNRNSAGVEQATTNAKPFSCAVPAWSSLCWLDVHSTELEGGKYRAGLHGRQVTFYFSLAYFLFFFPSIANPINPNTIRRHYFPLYAMTLPFISFSLSL